MKIIIDAGHGPDTPGKRAPDGSMREFEFNSAVADLLKTKLMGSGHSVLFSHSSAEDLPLAERVSLANRLKADIFVSVHANAYGTGFNQAGGIETYVYTKPLPASRTLADSIHSELIAATGRRDRGIKQADFMVLRETVMPAVLIECGFMTNRAELALLKSADYRSTCAEAAAKGILQCLPSDKGQEHDCCSC